MGNPSLVQSAPDSAPSGPASDRPESARDRMDTPGEPSFRSVSVALARPSKGGI